MVARQGAGAAGLGCVRCQGVWQQFGDLFVESTGKPGELLPRDLLCCALQVPGRNCWDQSARARE